MALEPRDDFCSSNQARGDDATLTQATRSGPANGKRNLALMVGSPSDFRFRRIETKPSKTMKGKDNEKTTK
jgi:hypothetical protein